MILLIPLLIFFWFPIGELLSHVSWAQVEEVILSSSFTKALLQTFWSGGLGALLSVVVATYFAHFFAQAEWRGQRLQRLLLLIPYLIPNFVLASAYVLSWNPATGVLGAHLPLPFALYSLSGLSFVFGVAHVPVAFLLVEDRIKKMDPALFEAARLSGASSFQTLRKIELPLLMPSLVSGFALCFALNISAFAIPAWIGAPERVFTLTYKIYQTLQMGGVEGMTKAPVIALVLFLISLPSFVINGWIQRREQKFVTVGAKPSAKGGSSLLSRRSFVIFQICFWSSQLVFWMLPFAAQILSTLVPPGCLQLEGLACLSEVTLRSYRYVLFELSETQVAIVTSLIYGGVAALTIVLISLTALNVGSTKVQRLRFLDWIFAIPLATPGAVLALAMIVTYSGKYGINLYNTAAIAVVAYILKHTSLCFQPLKNGYLNISPTLFEAGRVFGATKSQVWTQIKLPILRSEIVGGFFLVLIPILGELTMSIFLTSPGFRTIGTVIFDLQDYADHASAGALSVLLMLMILFLNELARWISRGRVGY